jgi:hypothetical protein
MTPRALSVGTRQRTVCRRCTRVGCANRWRRVAECGTAAPRIPETDVRRFFLRCFTTVCCNARSQFTRAGVTAVDVRAEAGAELVRCALTGTKTCGQLLDVERRCRRIGPVFGLALVRASAAYRSRRHFLSWRRDDGTEVDVAWQTIFERRI